MMTMALHGIAVLLVLSTYVVCSLSNQYDGEKVLRITPRTEFQVEMMRRLHRSPPKLSKVEFWKDPTVVGKPVDIQVDASLARKLIGLFEVIGLPCKVMIEDVGKGIDAQQANRHQKQPRQNFHTEYHTLDEIHSWMTEIAANHSNLVEMIQFGTSYEGRPILGLKLSTGGANKPEIWIDSGIHSREWVAVATVNYFIDMFVQGYGSDPIITGLLDAANFYMLPVFNVDGYEYTWTSDRLWRKTRSPNVGSGCAGSDPNRNFDFMWGTVGVSSNPCTNTYPGASPFSEVEVREVTEYIRTRTNTTSYIAYHSYGQMYMLPYGFTESRVPDFPELIAVCDRAIEELFTVHGEFYRCESLINLVGPNSGGSVDYFYGELGIKYSFGVELRDTGNFGFVLPPGQIIPTGEENLAALKVIAQHVVDNS